jgi:hypothetical protein
MQQQILVYDTKPHVAHLVGLLHTASIARNPTCRQPLPSVDDITAITKNESEENAVFIAQTEIAFLNNLSLDGDIHDDVSDTN